MDKLRKKYFIIGGIGVIAGLTAMLFDSNFLGGVALYLLLWGMFGDILANVTIVKSEKQRTVINTKNVIIDKGQNNDKTTNA